MVLTIELEFPLVPLLSTLRPSLARSISYIAQGGFIKNAVLSALLKAVGRDAAKPVLSTEDIRAGCAAQMRGALQMHGFSERLIPRHGLDHLVLPKKPVKILLKGLLSIVD